MVPFPLLFDVQIMLNRLLSYVDDTAIDDIHALLESLLLTSIKVEDLRRSVVGLKLWNIGLGTCLCAPDAEAAGSIGSCHAT